MSTMSNKVLFMVASSLDTATITVSSVTAGLPGTNVQNNLVRRVYRTAGIKNEWIVFDYGSEVDINGVFIGRHSFTSAATVKWQGHTSDSWASPALDLSMGVATDAQGNMVMKLAHFWATTQSYRYWRLYVEDSGNTDTTLDVGRVFAAQYIQPTRNMRNGYEVEEVDPSVGFNTAGRQGYWTTRDHYSELTYDVGDASEAQMDQFRSIYETVGQHTGFVVSLDPAQRPHHNSFYVQFMTPVKRKQRVLRQFGLEGIRLQEKT